MPQLDRILDANKLYRALNPWSASPGSPRPTPFASVEGSVRHDVDLIRAWPWLTPGTLVWGAVYDVDDASLRVVTPPE